MINIKKIILIALPIVFSGCVAKSTSDVEAFMFKSIPAERSNASSSKFLTDFSGSYKTLGDTVFTIENSGSFELDGITYTLHKVESDVSAVFKAETPLKDSTQKMITYHGVIISDKALYVAGFKSELDFSKAPKFTAEDTPYAGMLNANRIENIDFDIAKATRFAVKSS